MQCNSQFRSFVVLDFTGLSMGNTIEVNTLSYFELSILEFQITIFFHSNGCFDQLVISHHPSRFSTVGDGDQFYGEDKGGIWRNKRWAAHFTIGVLWLDI